MIGIDAPQLVVLVDDDPALRAATVQSLDLAGIAVRDFGDAHSALPLLARDFDGVLVTDIRMPRMDGLQLFERVKEIDAEIPVIFITGHADVPVAVRTLQQGAFDFHTKPFAVEELVAAIGNALEKRRLVLENRALREAIDDGSSPLIGDSPQMVTLKETILQIAQADVDVLVEGETGTGKELAARLLHGKSRRRGKPFIAVNCTALPDELAELELFGRAFGASRDDPKERVGRIEASNGGTLFLDDVDGTTPALQARLLRVLEEREVVPIGALEPRAINLRVLAASKRDLKEAVEAGEIRRDLYYRLNVVRLRLPPLREHRSDIPQLFAHFVDAAKQQMGIDKFAITDAVRRHLLDHDWPGNVRELRNFAFEAVLGIGQAEKRSAAGPPLSLAARLERFEASLLKDALTVNNGKASVVAATMQVSRRTLYEKLAKYGIDPSRYRKPG